MQSKQWQHKETMKEMNNILKNNKINKNRQKGFTLIETLVSVLILTIVISSFMAIVSSALSGSRYSKNEITANYLLQEAVDAIRNDRDTAFQEQTTSTNNGWSVIFLPKYGRSISTGVEVLSSCFLSSGCTVVANDISTPGNISACPASGASGGFGTITCPLFRYDQTASNKSFYNYTTGTTSIFKRKVFLSLNPSNVNELNIKVTLEWLNGQNLRSRTLQTTLLNWKQ